MDAYLAFAKSLQLDKNLSLWFEDGVGVIKAKAPGLMKTRITYKKKISLLGMGGLQTTILKTEFFPDGSFKNTMMIQNPSPVEIDIGFCSFEFKNAAGEVLGTQKASVSIVRGETIYQATGRFATKGNVDKVFLVGVPSSREGTWLASTLAWHNVPIKLNPELTQLFSA